MARRYKEEFLKTREITKWINSMSIALVKSVTYDYDNYEATIALEDLYDQSDWKGYVELIIMMIDDLGAESLYFNYGKNEISVYYG